MKSLEWDEHDFLYCLEVEPTVEDDGLEFYYEVEKNGLTVLVALIPYRSFVTVSLFQGSEMSPITSFSLRVAGEVSRKKDKYGERLQFKSCRFAKDLYEDEPHFDAENYSKEFPFTVELFVNPHIRIKFD